MKNNQAGTYALGRDIDAGITSTWNSGAGFQPIGAGNSFTGTLDGQGHTISGLSINRPSSQNVGLFGCIGAGAHGEKSASSVRPSPDGRWSAGIVGTNEGRSANVYSSGSVTATSAGAGGLVGYNFRFCRMAIRTAAVSGPLYVGGAVGLNNIAGLATGPPARYHRSMRRAPSPARAPARGCRRAGRLQRRLHHAVLLGQLHDGAGVRRRHAVRAA